MFNGFIIRQLIDAPIADDWVQAYSYPNVPNGPGRKSDGNLI
jgi:hypothetical protein